MTPTRLSAEQEAAIRAGCTPTGAPRMTLLLREIDALRAERDAARDALRALLSKWEREQHEDCCAGSIYTASHSADCIIAHIRALLTEPTP